MAWTINSDILKLKENKIEQIKAFENLLSVTYGTTYQLTGKKSKGKAAQIVLMTEMADYYRSLPVLSHSLENVLLQGNIRVYHPSSAKALFDAACKLRHPVLFRDCLYFCAGFRRADSSDYHQHIRDLDLKLQKIVKIARVGILEQVVQAHEKICKRSSEDEDVVEELLRWIYPLLANNMATDDENWEWDSCEGCYRGRSFFFCAEVADKDLPWDIEEKDW
ncbi:uncharacterized protein PAC_05247 [Phialocephala subalpina]|uniref:BTB domain-containing protein n=1 Tax=Phialocephala subalpina TaxID=576137 RepID=A0A1L7WRH1_9HELO|nr:uncharacterized protein PAC_05247 [Phialocephala subalpina]